MGYSFQLAARDLLYALFHRQDGTYTTTFVTPVVECWLAGRRGMDPKTQCIVSEHCTTGPNSAPSISYEGSEM